ncbi:hypothetical protein ATCC90586_000357 [Pythium insidiosum]|nr:hypothetical protein ATCC90586_000357 [Pythium insidiosum]
MQRDFGLLSIVLDNFDLWQATRYVVLTCIADLCVGVPENAVLAAQKRVWVELRYVPLLHLISEEIRSDDTKAMLSEKVPWMRCALAFSMVPKGGAYLAKTKFLDFSLRFLRAWPPDPSPLYEALGSPFLLTLYNWNSKRPSTALVRVALSNQLLRLLAILFAEDGMERKIIEDQSLMLLFEVLADIMTGSIVDTILIRPLIAVVDEVIYQHLSAYQQDATRRDIAVHCLRLLLALTTQCPQNARCLQKSSAQGIWLGLLPVVQADRSPVIAALFLRCVRQLCTQHLSLNHLRSFWAYLVELHPLTELEAFNEGAQLLLSVNEQLRLSLFAEHWDSSGHDYVSRLVLHICHLVETPQVPACVAAASLLISWCDSTTSGPLLLNDASSATKIGVCLARLACHPATVEAVVDVLRSEAAYSARGQVLNAVRDQYGCIIDLPRQYQASLLQLLSDVTTATGPGSNDPFDELTWGSIGKVAVTLWTAKDAYCCDAVLSAFPQLSRYRRLDRMQDLARDLREICTDVLNHRVIGVDPSVCLRAVYVIKMDMGFQLLDRETLEMRMVEEWVRGNYYSFGGGSRQQVGAMSSLDWLCTQGIGSDSLASEAACRVIARLLCRSDRYAWPVQRVVRGMLWVSDRNRRSLGNWLVRTETDFVDHVSWRIHNSLDAEAIGSFREAWEAMSHILESICMDEQTAFRLVRRRLVDAWLMEYLLSCDVDAFVTSSLSVANSRLLSCVLRHTESLLDTTLAGCIGRWLPLVQFCVYAIVFDGAHSAVALPALEILAILTRRDAFVRELWKVCQLDGKGHHVSVGLAILAPMAKLLDTTDASTRDRAASVLVHIARRSRGASWLVRSLVDESVGVMDLIANTLCRSVGTGVRQFIRSDPSDWSSPFVIFALPLSFTAASTAVSVLEILSRCLRDRSFRRELWDQIGLFEELFAALACHDARISAAAAQALRDAIWETTSVSLVAHGDEMAEVDVNLDGCRQLPFFTEIDSREDLLEVIPPTTLPSSFIILVLWIRFYAENHQQACAVDSVAVLLNILDVARYMVSFGQIGSMDAPSDEHHHTALGQALLRLSRRQGMRNSSGGEDADPAFGYDPRVRVRALLFLRDMCSELGIRFIDELFRTDDSIETLIRILETSDCEPEQHAAACLLTELVCSSSVQSVFLRDNDAFLKRIVWWLHEGHDEILQIAAMDILRSLTSKSLSVGTGAPLAAPIELLRTVAQVLLVDQDLSAESTAAVPSSTAVVTIVVDMKLDSSETPRDRRVLSVILHCCVLGEQDVLLREFQP